MYKVADVVVCNVLARGDLGHRLGGSCHQIFKPAMGSGDCFYDHRIKVVGGVFLYLQLGYACSCRLSKGHVNRNRDITRGLRLGSSAKSVASNPDLHGFIGHDHTLYEVDNDRLCFRSGVQSKYASQLMGCVQCTGELPRS